MEAMTAPTAAGDPVRQLSTLLESGEPHEVEKFLDALPPWEQARAVSRLSDKHHRRLLTILPPLRAAELMEIVSTTQAVDMIAGLDPQQAAVIMDGLPSKRQADLICEMSATKAQRILDQMVPEQAEEARQLASYPRNTAGGIMAKDYLAFPRHLSVEDVVAALRQYARQNANYQLQYAYVTDSRGKLIGVLRQRDLLFSPADRIVGEVMIKGPVRLPVGATIDLIHQQFELNSFLGLPVVDEQQRLVGVVTREAVDQTMQQHSNSVLLKISGIVGGEEFRTMPLYSRAGRRLAWLSCNILLNLLAAGVISAYTHTLEKVIVLAVFLPIISDMSGAAGSQSIAVSIRELTLGLIRPNEFLRVFFKEAAVGVVNGAALGVIMTVLAVVWKGNPWLGVVVGGALALNNLVAAVVGGVLPLLTKSLRMDPALMAAPLLTSITDMCGFFFVLSFASAMIDKLK